MRKYDEPTFLERGTRKAPPVPVYGSPKQVITDPQATSGPR